MTMNTDKDVIGFRRGSKAEMWFIETAWPVIDEHRRLKAKKEQAFKTGINIEQFIEDYKDKEVKIRCRLQSRQRYMVQRQGHRSKEQMQSR